LTDFSILIGPIVLIIIVQFFFSSVFVPLFTLLRARGEDSSFEIRRYER